MLVALGLCIVLIAVALPPIFLVLAVAACGLWFEPLNTLRTLILGELLPASQLSEGFSTLSAASRLATGPAASRPGVVLGFAGARACFIVAAVLTIGVVSAPGCCIIMSKAPRPRRHQNRPLAP